MPHDKKIILFIAALAVLLIGGAAYIWQSKEDQPGARSFANCEELDSSWALYSNPETSLSFCYKTSWGTTALKESGTNPEAREGTIYYISFSQSVNNHPLIGYSTLDFRKLGDSDVPPIIDWSALDFNKSETELAELFPNENATTEKLIVNNQQVLKVARDFIEPFAQERIVSTSYFVPNVTIDETTYNLYILGSTEQEADLDQLIASMVF